MSRSAHGGVCLALLLAGLTALAGCATHRARAPGAARSGEVERGVRALLEQIASDLEQHGPEAWLPHLADVPGFCMASSGALVFPDHGAAREFLAGFDASVSSLRLDWSDVRVDALGDDVAWVGAAYDELLVDTAGVEQRFAGYFSGVAIRRGGDWALKTLHWSSPL